MSDLSPQSGLRARTAATAAGAQRQRRPRSTCPPRRQGAAGRGWCVVIGRPATPALGRARATLRSVQRCTGRNVALAKHAALPRACSNATDAAGGAEETTPPAAVRTLRLATRSPNSASSPCSPRRERIPIARPRAVQGYFYCGPLLHLGRPRDVGPGARGAEPVRTSKLCWFLLDLRARRRRRLSKLDVRPYTESH
jgi:hypothetical protein